MPHQDVKTDQTESAGPQSGTALRVVDLEKSFGALPVIRGISLAAEESSVLSIIGASGSGKSTLLICFDPSSI